MLDIMPITYDPQNDNTIVFIFVLCLIVGLLALSQNWDHLLRDVKSFFFIRDYSHFFSNSIDRLCRYVLCGQTVVLLGLEYYIANRSHNIILYIFIFLLYFTLRFILYGCVNHYSFDKVQVKNWKHILIFMTAFEGICLFPIVTTHIYLGLSTRGLLYTSAILILVIKIGFLYKSNCMFFRSTSGFVQNILYFCMLEIGPVLLLNEVMERFIDITAIS